MIRVCFFLFGVLILVGAQVPNLGFCPKYVPMADFDIDSFLGKWYETERYFEFTKVAARCVVTDYARGPSGKIYVSNEVTNSLTGIKRVVEGNMELTSRTGEGRFTLKYNTTPLNSQADILVLSTDYDNYAVLWSCSGFGPIHTQSVWAMTRERLPPNPVLQQIYGILDEYKISRNFVIKTNQEGCALAASDLNAANGITSTSTIVESTGLPQRNAQVLNKINENEKVKLLDDILISPNVHLSTSGQKSTLAGAMPPANASKDEVVKTISFVSEPVKVKIDNTVTSYIQNGEKNNLESIPDSVNQSETVPENEKKSEEVLTEKGQENNLVHSYNDNKENTNILLVTTPASSTSLKNVPLVSVTAPENLLVSETAEFNKNNITSVTSE